MKLVMCVYPIAILLAFASSCGAWKAIPANQAMYALRSPAYRFQPTDEEQEAAFLPRDNLQNIYKFGWCTPDATAMQYFRKSINVTLPDWQSTQLNFIYLVARKHTINHNLQCIVMKSYVPSKFLFYKSRLPLYYCQGIVYVLMLNTITRYEIHEFFLHSKLNMPISFTFEFYHPHAL